MLPPTLYASILSPEKSRTFVTTGAHFEERYGSGNVSGVVGRDNAYLSGLHLHQTVMGSVSYESSAFNFFKQDGIFGMALPSLSELTKGGRNTALINLFDTSPSDAPLIQLFPLWC